MNDVSLLGHSDREGELPRGREQHSEHRGGAEPLCRGREHASL